MNQALEPHRPIEVNTSISNFLDASTLYTVGWPAEQVVATAQEVFSSYLSGRIQD